MALIDGWYNGRFAQNGITLETWVYLTTEQATRLKNGATCTLEGKTGVWKLVDVLAISQEQPPHLVQERRDGHFRSSGFVKCECGCCGDDGVLENMPQYHGTGEIARIRARLQENK